MLCYACGAILPASVARCALCGYDHEVSRVRAREDDLVVSLLQDDGVLTHPGYFFDFARESFLVVSLLPPRAAFEAGIAGVLRHFACTVSKP